MTTSPISEMAARKHAQEWTDAIEVNRINGWFDEQRPLSADIALLHSEVSEAYEAVRKGNFTGGKDSFQDEIADVFIRLLDTCYRHDIHLTKQFLQKMTLNETHGYHHGGKTE